MQVFQEVLGVSTVSVEDSFFKLGGHSLLAIRLMAEIRNRCGQLLPLSTLFRTDTVAGLACILYEQDSSLLKSPLVGIQTRGSKRPFFCVHPANGEVLIYTGLAHQLGLDQPFYGLQAAHLWSKQKQYTRIEDVARDYVEAILTVQVEGPFLLGGYSMGGAIAFEMAQQLQERGHEVGLVVMIEAKAPKSDYRPTTVYPKRLVIFRGTGKPEPGEGSRGPLLGWDEFALGSSLEIEVIHVPGSHNSVLDEFYLPNFAELLSKSLEDVQRGSVHGNHL